MKRCAIYARFSTDLQHDRSIDDQVALCRTHADRQGWTVVDVYPDYAVSGATIHGRFGFKRLVADARQGAFEIILAEDLDRLSRGQADLAGLHELTKFLGVSIFTIADGLVNSMHIGLKGTMSALFLEGLKIKIHRGMAGRVREGKIPGGLAYGYRVTGVGEREINPDQAAVILRVFQEMKAGYTAVEIAERLNRDGVLAPRGGKWNRSTILGSAGRDNGILRNPLYVGKLVWNRQQFLKDPDTGKRVTRLNPGTDRMTTDVPHLQIVSEDLWAYAQDKLGDRAGRNGKQPFRQRPRSLFSGLIKCGCCGGSYSSSGGKYPNLSCSGRTESRSCVNRRTVSVRIIECRALVTLETSLLDDRLISDVVEEYNAERARLRAGSEHLEARRARRMKEIDVEIDRLLTAITSGVSSAAAARRIQTLETERAGLELGGRRDTATVINFEPDVAERYRALVRDLRSSLAERTADGKREVVQQVRSLVDRIVVYPRDDAAGRDLELYGQISGLFAGPFNRHENTTGGVSVAEEGLEPPTRGL